MRFPGLHFLRNLVERRNLIVQLVRRDFSQRFVGSSAGWLWGVVHPLVLLVSWVFVFQVCMRIAPPPEALNSNYALYLFCGFLPWMLFQETVQRSATCLPDQQNLITKTVFPAEVIPVSVFLSSLVNHAIALVLAIGAIAAVDIYKLKALHHLGPGLLSLPAYTVGVGLFAIGIAWIVSSLHVYIRDTAQVLSVIMTFWFWFTPIFIYESLVPERFRFVLRLNPLAYVVRGYRAALLSDKPLDVRDFAVIAAAGGATFVVGGLVFRHLKRGFADVL